MQVRDQLGFCRLQSPEGVFASIGFRLWRGDIGYGVSRFEAQYSSICPRRACLFELKKHTAADSRLSSRLPDATAD